MTKLQTLHHPAAWRGSELFDRPEWQLEFTAAELDELLLAVQHSKAQAMPVTGESDAIPLPTLQPKLAQIQNWLEAGSGVVRLLGFPALEVDEETAKRAFWMLCRYVGTAVSQSATGERIFSVRDAGFAHDDKRARGPNTRKKLSFHTDRCDVVSFLCYRQAKSGGENLVVSSMSLFNQILAARPDLAEVLTQSYLYQRHNVDAGNALPYCEQPIFSIYAGQFAANLLRVLIDRAYAMPDTPRMTDLQREALDFVEEMAERPALQATFRQQPGDILFLNNFVTLHRRTEFVDFDELDRKRHLLRIWLSVPNSRALDPRFEANYGATAAGAIRGGMRPQQES